MGGRRFRIGRRRLFPILADATAFGFLCFSALNVSGATSTWDGSGSDNNWSTGQNWSPIGAPGNDGSANIVMAGNTRTSPNVDAPWSINSLTFGQANAFTIGGQTLTIGAGGITNSSNALQTLNMPVVLGASQTWMTGTQSSAYLFNDGTLDTDGYTLTITGSGGGGLLNGGISGSGSLAVSLTGSAALASYNANSYSGGTYLDSGELYVTQDSSLGAASSPLIFNGGLLEIGSAFTVSRDVTINSGGGTLADALAQNTYDTVSSNMHGPGHLKLIGNWSFTGNNSYSGGTSLAAASLLGTTDSLQGNFSLADIYSTILFRQNFNGTYSGSISGGGEVSIQGSGIVSFSGNNTYTSDTQLYSGALEVSLTGNGLSPNSRLDFYGNVTQSGGPVLQIVGGGLFSRPFSQVAFAGPGGFAARDGKLTVNIGNSGQFTLSPFDTLVFGSPTANSETEFQNPIYLGSAQSSPTPIVEVDSGAGGDFALLSGVISGANYFVKTGTGELILNAANTYTGPTVVSGGSFIINGSLAKTAVSVQGGAVLGGTGSIAGSVTLSAGSSATSKGEIDLVDGAPGVLVLSDPAATDTVLTIGGSAGSGSLIDMEVGSTADDIVAAAGKVLVKQGGGQINIIPLPGFGPGVYDLLDFQAGQATGLNFLTLAQSSLDGYPLLLRSTNTSEELVVVPEPSGVALVAVAALCGIARRRPRWATV